MKEQVKKKPKGRGKVGLASACRLAEASRATRPVVCHPWASPARQRQKKRKRSTSPEGTQAASSFDDFRAFSSGSAPSAASESAPTGSPASGPDASPLLCTTIRKSLSRLCGDSCSVRIFRFRPPLGPPSARFLLSQQRRLLRRMLHIHATPPCNAAQLSRAAACGSSRESATENKSLATKGITQRATRGGLAAVNAPDAPLPKSSSAATPSPSSCGSLCRWCDTTRFSCPPMLHLPCWKSAFRVEEGDSECEEETHSQTLDPDGMQSPTQEGRRAGAGEASAESRFRDRISGDHALAPPDLFSSFQSRHVLYVHPQVVLKENPETGCSLFLRGDVQHGTLLMAARSLVCSWDNLPETCGSTQDTATVLLHILRLLTSFADASRSARDGLSDLPAAHEAAPASLLRELRFFFPRTSAETARVQERTLGRERQDGSPDGILGVGWSTGDADLDRRVASMLKALEGTPFAFSKETFAQLVLQLRLNLLATPQLPDVLCFPRFFESMNSISLVPGLCLFNHSCLPNLSVHSLGDIHLIFARGHVGRASRRSESQGASRDSAAALSAEEPAAEALASAGDETELSFAYGGEAAAGECGVHRPRTRQRRWGGGADESGADESGADESGADESGADESDEDESDEDESDEDESDEDEDCASRGDRESGKARQVKSPRGVARDFVCACARCRREAEEEAAQRRREERREKTPSKKKASRESESEDDMEDEAVSVMEDIRDELRAMRPVERIEFIEAVFTHAALPDSPPLLLEEEQDLLSTLSISHLQKFDFAASLVACARAMLSCCVLERISKASQRDRETDRLEAFGCARLSPAQRRLLLAPVPGPHARFSSCAETPAAGDAGDADEAWTWRYGDVRTWNLSGLVCFAVQAAVSLLLLVDAAETQAPKCGAPAAGASAKRGAATEREADAKGGGFPCQRVEHGRQDGGSSKCGVNDIDAEGRQTARDVEANARCASEREIAKDLIRHASRLHRTLQGGDFRLFLARFEGDFSLAFLNSQGAFGLSSLHAAALKRADVWRVAEEVCVADARQAMRGEKQKKNWSQEGARRVDEAGDDKQGEETEQRKRGGKMEAACEARDEAERGAGHGGDEALISAVELLQLARALAKRKTREEENTTRGDSVEYEGRKKKKVRKEKRGTDRSATLKKKDKMRARQPADADGEMRRPKKDLNKRKKIKMSLKISNQGESGGDCKTNLKREKKGEGKRAKLRRRAT